MLWEGLGDKWIAQDDNHRSPERYDTHSMDPDPQDPPEQCVIAGARLVTNNVAGCAVFESIII